MDIELQVAENSAIEMQAQDAVRVTVYGSYAELPDKPSINGFELVGDKTAADLKIYVTAGNMPSDNPWGIDNTIGNYATVEGFNNVANGNFSHAEGNFAHAVGSLLSSAAISPTSGFAPAPRPFVSFSPI